jgi:hypothetical protein
MRTLLSEVLLLVFVSSSIGFAAEKAGDDVKSGLPVGEVVPAFNVRDITGPQRGKTLCYRCRFGNAPTVAIFAREIDDSLKALVKQIDDRQVAEADKGLKSFVIFINDDPDTIEPKIESLAKDQKLTGTPLTLIEGVQGPPEYKIAKDATVTVMMWVEGEVKVNRAFAKNKLDAAAVKQLVGETSKILGN